MLVFSLLLIVALPCSSFKFLAYSPQFSDSHSNFVAVISDILVEAGHDVVFLSPTITTAVRARAKKARTIQLDQIPEGIEWQNWMASEDHGMARFAWRGGSNDDLQKLVDSLDGAFVAQCISTMNNRTLIEELRAEKFDAAFAEPNDYCGFGLFHVLGIDKIAVTTSMSVVGGGHIVSQAPFNPAFTPAMFGGEFTDDMSLMERAQNALIFIRGLSFRDVFRDQLQAAIQSAYPATPPLNDILANNSLVFLSSDPFYDFPQTYSSKMINIGGIITSKSTVPLSQEWSSILELRPRTVIISFGSVAKSQQMPEEYRNSVIEAIRAFPDVTFLWKYEGSAPASLANTKNAIVKSWLPQNALLNDPRVVAFVTHCGLGSVTEALFAGTPMVAVPLTFDQHRNAQMVKSRGVARALSKTDLASPHLLEDALRDVLDSAIYSEKASKMSRILKNKPFSARENFIRNMEFLAEFGPFRQLDNRGATMTFMQYYLLDVVLIVVSAGLVAISLICLVVMRIVKSLRVRKVKTQ